MMSLARAGHMRWRGGIILGSFGETLLVPGPRDSDP